MGETNAVFRQPVERRRLNVFVAVAVDVVGAEGVDGDQKNVGLRGSFLRRPVPKSGRGQPENDQYPSGLHAFQTSIISPCDRAGAWRGWDIILPSDDFLPVSCSPRDRQLAAGSSAAFAAPAAAPNVVVITIDTLRADHLGCYGYKQIRTPNIDALAAEGARFERAYTAVPVTLPSHTVMFTGTYPMRSGMHDFAANKLGPGQPTLASVLKEHGYVTGAVIGSAVLDSRFGLNRGFDFYYDHFDFNRLQESNLEEMERPGNLVADVALDWLGQNYQKKFFLWMHLYDPHYPYHPPAPYAAEYQDHPYDGEIAFADSQVGRLIHFLKSKGLYENTMIVLTGDHGESLGEHGEKYHGFFIYNATLHVPFIIHLPGAASPRVVPGLVNLADLMPTVLQELKIDVPAQVQGQNLLPLMRTKEPGEDRTLYAETFLPRLHFNWSELRGVETDNYHFIDAPKPELYDLTKDPGRNPQSVWRQEGCGRGDAGPPGQTDSGVQRRP